MDEYLFDMPKPVNQKPKNQRCKWAQQERCKRCSHSAEDNIGAYCFKFDLCIQFENGVALLAKNNQRLICDGKKWTY